ncbi:MAG: SusC/RagA family protein [Zunongwangia sp.]|uniref:SusC/RagA family protein n=2 Tax=Zunongwangia profunda TaxID=398743 RepID=A0A3D5IVB5_9FLAO|nr:TonB-dependent receptor [Zunongwangia profunda]MAO37921.1 SusC/RagA family protein [Zunongwangia sp.]MAS70753.1 SusC/RagA family protein [Zunongwangia sp.]HCV79623.1 SusC/RagA family protein [Zunongwangia profunda]
MNFTLKNFVILIIFMITTVCAKAQIDISGTVTDSKGIPLPGVNVIEGETSNGTITDFDGNFNLEVNSLDSKLIFSSIGFQSKTMPIPENGIIKVTLEDDLQQLSEVVVVGYGNVQRKDLTGSVSTLKTEKIEDIPSNSIERNLQGRIAGLQVSTPSQDPGAGATVRIRGGSSLRGSNSPLIVVDGFPLGDAGNLKQINPADIETVDVLKDASASAIYGSRGANGVIIITTSRAKEGKTSVRIQQQSSLSYFNSEVDLWRDPVLLAQINNESRINGGFTPFYIGAENATGIYYPSVSELQSGDWPYFTSWDDIVFRDTPVSNNTTISVNTGTEKTSFNLSANYFTDMGVYKNDDYSKANYNLRVDHNLFDNFKIRFSNIVSKGNRYENSGLAYWRNPIFPVYDENGDYFLVGTNDYSHPVAISDNRLDQTKTIDLITSLALEYDIIDALKLTSRFNYKFGESINDQFFPNTYTEAGDFNNGAAYINNWESNRFVTETFANYDDNFGDHNIGITAGFTYENYLQRSSSLGAFDFVNETLQNENIGAGNPELNRVSNGHIETELVSGIFRMNYGYLDRYLATFTGRVDGSSKFGENNKWAFFPSGALSWKIHEENFLKDSKKIDQLKLRFSYGISGNQGISPYQTLSRYGVSQYYDNGSWVTAIGPGYEVGRAGQGGIEVLWGGIPNPDLKWETTSQYDIGVDMAFFEERLSLTFDYYKKQTKDLLRERILSPSSSYDRIWINNGEIANEGVELSINANLIENDNFSLSSSIIFFANENEVVDLGGVAESGLTTDPNTGMRFEYSGVSLEQFRQYPNILAVGQPVNVFYGFRTDGIIQNLQEGIDAGLDGELAQPGEFKYVDVNGDGIINLDDRTIIGDPNPDFNLSLGLNLDYKNFDFSVFFNGSFGQDVINTQRFNQPSNLPLRWTLDNPTNEYPRLRDGRQTYFSDWWVENGSFVRLQNLTFGYSIPLNESFINKARIYVNGNNLYTFTDFEGYDPEVGTDGIYWGGYPRLRQVTIGLDLNF